MFPGSRPNERHAPAGGGHHRAVHRRFARLLAWLRRGAAPGPCAIADPLAAVGSDWVAVVARLTGYSVTINDAERRLIWINDSFTRLTGYTAAEAIGQRTSELLYFPGTDAATIARVRESFAARR